MGEAMNALLAALTDPVKLALIIGYAGSITTTIWGVGVDHDTAVELAGFIAWFVTVVLHLATGHHAKVTAMRGEAAVRLEQAKRPASGPTPATRPPSAPSNPTARQGL